MKQKGKAIEFIEFFCLSSEKRNGKGLKANGNESREARRKIKKAQGSRQKAKGKGVGRTAQGLAAGRLGSSEAGRLGGGDYLRGIWKPGAWENER